MSSPQTLPSYLKTHIIGGQACKWERSEAQYNQEIELEKCVCCNRAHIQTYNKFQQVPIQNGPHSEDVVTQFE